MILEGERAYAREPTENQSGAVLRLRRSSVHAPWLVEGSYLKPLARRARLFSVSLFVP